MLPSGARAAGKQRSFERREPAYARILSLESPGYELPPSEPAFC